MITQEELKATYEYRDGNLYFKVIKPGCGLNKKVGSMNKRGYIRTIFNGHYLYIHRMIFLMHHGYLPEQVDHINGKKTDNRIENLRAATASQNKWNVGIRKNNTSGVKGVHRHRNKWRASICINSKSKHIGLFDTIEEAKKAVEAYREELHKEFARHE